MKTVNNILKRNPLIVVLLILLLITSCGNEKGKGIKYPVPEENPVYFTSEAGTKNIYVENITMIVAENPDTDIVEQTDISPRWIIIKNDWATFRYGQSDLPKNFIEITLNENTSKEPRKYNLLVYGSPVPIPKITFEIIQEGVK